MESRTRVGTERRILLPGENDGKILDGGLFGSRPSLPDPDNLTT